MDRMIFVNLPVADLARATQFYEAVGAVKDERFSDPTASGMSWSPIIHVMLLTHEKFGQFTPKTIPDARQTCQVLLALSAESRDEVDTWIEKAAAAGGRRDPGPLQDHGFMYGRSFEDPDGHVWEVFWMDPAVAAGQPPAAA